MMQNDTARENQQPPRGSHPFPESSDVYLEILQGRAQHKIRPVSAPVFLIGAALDCDLVLGDSQFPEAHTYLFLNEDGVLLRYLGDGPKVKLQGGEVISASLKDGDHISMGDYEFVIRIQQNASPPDNDREYHNRCLPKPHFTPTSDIGIDEVQSLLADVQLACPPKPSRLRLYVEPESPDFSKPTDSKTPWNQASA